MRASAVAVVLALAVAAMPASAAPLGDLAGRMILLGFRGLEPGEPEVERVAGQLRGGRLGGVLLLGHNIRDRAQLRRLVAHLRDVTPGPPPLIAIDQEGGRVQRFGPEAGARAVPSAAAVARRPAEAARAVYTPMADELAALGITLNLGPVLDLAVEPANPVIVGKGRSYGADPGRVAAFARAFVDAHRARGIATAAKHFPGHGSSLADTHERPADITESWREAELAPYAALAREGRLDAVMLAHVAHATLTGGRDHPASLSRRLVERWLRPLLGWDVVVMTDDLEMAAVRVRAAPVEAAVSAIAAGADLVLLSNSWEPDPARAEKVAAAVVRAVGEGHIPRARLEGANARLDALRRHLR